MKNRYNIIPRSAPMDNPDNYLDFDQILQGASAASAPNKSFRGYLLVVGILTLLLSAWWGLDQLGNTDLDQLPAPTEEQTNPVVEEEKEPTEDSTPVVNKESESVPVVEESHNEELVEPPVEEASPIQDESPEIQLPSPKAESEDQTEMAYVKAVPMEGIAKLYEYFHNELVYPEGDTLSGIMVSSFTITETGEITDIKIENSLGEAFDKEVIRLLTNMPEWEPATVNGTPVKSKISIPFTFNAP